MRLDFKAMAIRGRADLARLLMLLIAMVGDKLSAEQYRAVQRRLRPLESAIRRLIVIAARDIVVLPRAKSALPEGGIPKGTGSRIGAFPLFDRRLRPVQGIRYIRGAGPQIRFLDEPALPEVSPAPAMNSDPLKRRLARAKRALSRIGEEAMRLARWRLRNPDNIKRPMRPGRPPGLTARANGDPIQKALKELQLSALYALEPG